jgi:hypothetical protein
MIAHCGLSSSWYDSSCTVCHTDLSAGYHWQQLQMQAASWVQQQHQLLQLPATQQAAWQQQMRLAPTQQATWLRQHQLLQLPAMQQAAWQQQPLQLPSTQQATWMPHHQQQQH